RCLLHIKSWHRGPQRCSHGEQGHRALLQKAILVNFTAGTVSRRCRLPVCSCGSGLSGEHISEEGHCWIGVDISRAMLDVAVEREVEGDLLLADMGDGIPFRPGTFDGCIRGEVWCFCCLSNCCTRLLTA
uniref:Methyltransferase type 11 domain-containing protein n=1 Tax=Meleagris gallopavo TaxID=9103 RepID=A0A803YMZ1_MELGA